MTNDGLFQINQSTIKLEKQEVPDPTYNSSSPAIKSDLSPLMRHNFFGIVSSDTQFPANNVEISKPPLAPSTCVKTSFYESKSQYLKGYVPLFAFRGNSIFSQLYPGKYPELVEGKELSKAEILHDVEEHKKDFISDINRGAENPVTQERYLGNDGDKTWNQVLQSGDELGFNSLAYSMYLAYACQTREKDCKDLTTSKNGFVTIWSTFDWINQEAAQVSRVAKTSEGNVKYQEFQEIKKVVTFDSTTNDEAIITSDLPLFFIRTEYTFIANAESGRLVTESSCLYVSTKLDETLREKLFQLYTQLDFIPFSKDENVAKEIMQAAIDGGFEEIAQGLAAGEIGADEVKWFQKQLPKHYQDQFIAILNAKLKNYFNEWVITLVSPHRNEDTISWLYQIFEEKEYLYQKIQTILPQYFDKWVNTLVAQQMTEENALWLYHQLTNEAQLQFLNTLAKYKEKNSDPEIKERCYRFLRWFALQPNPRNGVTQLGNILDLQLDWAISQLNKISSKTTSQYSVELIYVNSSNQTVKLTIDENASKLLMKTYLREGKLQKYPTKEEQEKTKSTHIVVQVPIQDSTVSLYFKGFPYQVIETKAYNRLMHQLCLGGFSASNTFGQVIIQVGKERHILPVQISMGIPGQILTVDNKKTYDQLSLVNHIISAVLTNSGDLDCKNIIEEPLTHAVTVIDNNYWNQSVQVPSFLQKLTGDRTFQLKIILACLPQVEKLTLPPSWVKLWRHLNIEVVLSQWWKHIQIQQNCYQSLFTSDQLQQWKKEDDFHLQHFFIGGVLVRLKSVLQNLQNALLFDQSELRLLDILTKINPPYALSLQKTLQRPQLTPEERLQKLTGQDTTVSYTSHEAVQINLTLSGVPIEKQDEFHQLSATVDELKLLKRVDSKTLSIDFSYFQNPQGRNTLAEKLFIQHTLIPSSTTSYQYIEIINSEELTDESLIKILMGSRNTLTSLDIRHCKKLTEKSINVALGSCPKLTELFISGIPLSFFGSPQKAIVLNNIQTLHLSNNKRITTINIISKKLRHLKINLNPSLTNLKIEADQLEHLDMSACDKVDHLEGSFASLKELLISECSPKLPSSLAGRVSWLENLMMENIAFPLSSDSDLNQQSVHIFRDFPNLKKVTTRGCSGILTLSLTLTSLPTPPLKIPTVIWAYLGDGVFSNSPSHLAVDFRSLAPDKIPLLQKVVRDSLLRGAVIESTQLLYCDNLKDWQRIIDATSTALDLTGSKICAWFFGHEKIMRKLILDKTNLTSIFLGREKLQELKELHLNHCDDLTEITTSGSFSRVKIIATHNPKLKKINMPYECEELDFINNDALIEVIVNSKILNVSNCKNLRRIQADERLETLVVNDCPSLETIDILPSKAKSQQYPLQKKPTLIPENKKISDISLLYFLGKFPAIRSIYTRNCGEIKILICAGELDTQLLQMLLRDVASYKAGRAREISNATMPNPDHVGIPYNFTLLRSCEEIINDRLLDSLNIKSLRDNLKTRSSGKIVDPFSYSEREGIEKLEHSNNMQVLLYFTGVFIAKLIEFFYKRQFAKLGQIAGFYSIISAVFKDEIKAGLLQKINKDLKDYVQVLFAHDQVLEKEWGERIYSVEWFPYAIVEFTQLLTVCFHKYLLYLTINASLLNKDNFNAIFEQAIVFYQSAVSAVISLERICFSRVLQNFSIYKSLTTNGNLLFPKQDKDYEIANSIINDYRLILLEKKKDFSQVIPALVALFKIDFAEKFLLPQERYINILTYSYNAQTIWVPLCLKFKTPSDAMMYCTDVDTVIKVVRDPKLLQTIRMSSYQKQSLANRNLPTSEIAQFLTNHQTLKEARNFYFRLIDNKNNLCKLFYVIYPQEGYISELKVTNNLFEFNYPLADEYLPFTPFQMQMLRQINPQHNPSQMQRVVLDPIGGKVSPRLPDVPRESEDKSIVWDNSIFADFLEYRVALSYQGKGKLRLDLNNSSTSSWTISTIREKLANVASFRNISCISITGNIYNKDILQQLIINPQILRQIDLQGCTGVDEGFIANILSQFRQLEVLNLNGTDLKKLSTHYLYQTKLTVYVNQCSYLETVDVEGRLVGLEARNCSKLVSVRVAAVAHLNLEECKQLQSLQVSGARQLNLLGCSTLLSISAYEPSATKKLSVGITDLDWINFLTSNSLLIDLKYQNMKGGVFSKFSNPADLKLFRLLMNDSISYENKVINQSLTTLFINFNKISGLNVPNSFELFHYLEVVTNVLEKGRFVVRQLSGNTNRGELQYVIEGGDSSQQQKLLSDYLKEKKIKFSNDFETAVFFSYVFIYKALDYYHNKAWSALNHLSISGLKLIKHLMRQITEIDRVFSLKSLPKGDSLKSYENSYIWLESKKELYLVKSNILKNCELRDTKNETRQEYESSRNTYYSSLCFDTVPTLDDIASKALSTYVHSIEGLLIWVKKNQTLYRVEKSKLIEEPCDSINEFSNEISRRLRNGRCFFSRNELSKFVLFYQTQPNYACFANIDSELRKLMTNRLEFSKNLQLTDNYREGASLKMPELIVLNQYLFSCYIETLALKNFIEKPIFSFAEILSQSQELYKVSINSIERLRYEQYKTIFSNFASYQLARTQMYSPRLYQSSVRYSPTPTMPKELLPADGFAHFQKALLPQAASIPVSSFSEDPFLTLPTKKEEQGFIMLRMGNYANQKIALNQIQLDSPIKGCAFHVLPELPEELQRPYGTVISVEYANSYIFVTDKYEYKQQLYYVNSDQNTLEVLEFNKVSIELGLNVNTTPTKILLTPEQISHYILPASQGHIPACMLPKVNYTLQHQLLEAPLESNDNMEETETINKNKLEVEEREDYEKPLSLYF